MRLKTFSWSIISSKVRTLIACSPWVFVLSEVPTIAASHTWKTCGAFSTVTQLPEMMNASGKAARTLSRSAMSGKSPVHFPVIMSPLDPAAMALFAEVSSESELRISECFT